MIQTQSPVAQAGLSMFFNLARQLDLNVEKQAVLLGVSAKTIGRYRKECAEHTADIEDRNTLERMSHIINTYVDLRSIFHSSEDAVRWLTSGNNRFGGATPLDRMLGGNVSDLVDVRRFAQEALLR